MTKITDDKTAGRFKRLRLFIAVPLPPNARRALYETQSALLNSGASGRFVPTKNFHITIKFLGETDESDLAEITSAMHAAQADARPIALSLGVFSTFQGGGGHTGHILVNDPKKELMRLHELLESALVDRGFPGGRQRFLPHITLGRNLEGIDVELPVRHEAFTADSIVLYESRIKDGSPEYCVLHREVF